LSDSSASPDIATCTYSTGIDPFTKQEVYVTRGLRDRKMQRAPMQSFKPENYFQVRERCSRRAGKNSSATAATA
jgi:hypothetical protein